MQSVSYYQYCIVGVQKLIYFISGALYICCQHKNYLKLNQDYYSVSVLLQTGYHMDHQSGRQHFLGK